MALRIKDGNVISISPPANLTKKQLEEMENAPTNEKLIKKAASRKYNIVHQSWFRYKSMIVVLLHIDYTLI